METTEESSAKWISIIREAFVASDGTAKGVAASLATALGARAGAVVEGMAELASYASSALEPEATASDAEEEALAVSRRIMRPALEAKLQARLDALDKELAGRAVCPDCQGTAESQGRRGRMWHGLFGRLSLRRRYAHCTKCGRGVAPAQRALGLTDSEFTPRLEELTTMMATVVPFGMATALVGKLCGIEVSIKGVQEMVERRAEAVHRVEAEEAETYAPLDAQGLPVERQPLPADTVPESAVPDVAYLETDGVIPITREELPRKELTRAERRRLDRAEAAHARGGKGRRYRIIGREVKNAVLYDGKDCATESPGRGCILKKTYVSHLGDWLTFAALLWVAMLRLRFHQAKLLVVLSDGAEWIRSLADWLPVPTLLILDLFHVKHRIWEVASSVYGDRSEKARLWANSQCDRVEAGQADKVIQALNFLRTTRAESKELIEKLATYLDNNRDRMDYPAYRARRLRISSGTVESANFHVTGTRLMLQGMRWSALGAGQMASLRADLFNGRWDSRSRELLRRAA
jgi:hypothetical protein